ncbi:MAG: ABC transporter ATP-binding protein [Chloroflexi bacterium]|nr:ABC transporter ATP-binding protein [Chloroflexota bacterium]MDA8188888.1 ABC transporter ATP-binding protein [Dehalococcoidales bacterium]
MLRVEAAEKSFDGFKAVNRANLVVEEGAIVAVIGPNGAGKTTLFNLIAGIHKPDTGKILFQGENICGLAPYDICRRGIARAFQIANIFHRLTVFENVQVSVLSQQRKSGVLFRPAQNLAVEETNSILASTGLLNKARRVAGTLSHGDQRILEMAIALGSQPRLLILDEPTAGMSPEETTVTMELVKHLSQARGLTILFCEHDMDIVFSVAQSIMVMQHGQTIIQGEPEEVRQNEQVQEAYLGGALSLSKETSDA